MAHYSPTFNPKTVIFDDVVIRFTRQTAYDNEQVFQLEVRQSPHPLSGGVFQANIDTELAKFQEMFNQRVSETQFFYRFEQPVDEFESVQIMTDLGKQLYNLLPETFRQTFPRLLQTVFEKGRGVRLVFEAQPGDKADRLLSLPWELLFFEETKFFLAHSPRVLIVRHLVEAIRRSPVKLEPPFDVTHVIAHNPNAPREKQIDETLQQTERETIRQAAMPGNYQLVEAPGSVEQMLTVLRKQPSYVVHFLGHGELPEADVINASNNNVGRSYLQFVGADGKPQWVAGEHLQQLLSFTPTVQLVVLNACHGGSSVATNVATQLVYNGLPNVVAIQSDILQEAAKYFIEAFYIELQAGAPIEYAIAAGRAAIVANMPQVIDWCLPVLYTNVGLLEQSSVVKTSNKLWQWASQPKATYRAGLVNLIVGLLHLIVGSLLLLSGTTPSLPNASVLVWFTSGLSLIPLFLTAIVYWTDQLLLPTEWSLSNRMALVLNSLGSASIGLGLSTLNAGFVLLLLVSLGFWELLSPVARYMLLGLIFAPGILLSYSQIVGHGRAFVTNSQVELPTVQCADFFIPIVGIIIIFLLPWLFLSYLANFLALPYEDFIVGGWLCWLGLVFILSVTHGYSQTVGYGRAFITNSQVELPTVQWADYLILIAGYFMIWLPWLALNYLADFLALPYGNFIVGGLLCWLGYMMYQDDS